MAARVSMAVLTRSLLVVLTFVLIVVLSQVALVSARTRLERADLPTIAQQAWEGTQDMVLVVLAVGVATLLGVVVGILAAASRGSRSPAGPPRRPCWSSRRRTRPV